MKNTQSASAHISLAIPSPSLTNLGAERSLAEGAEAGVMALLTDPGLHEFYAGSSADAATVSGFGLGAGLTTSSGGDLVWAIHDLTGMEIGRPHGPGLHQMGITPEAVLVVRARDVRTLLSVGEDALRTKGVGAVLLSAWGEDRAFSLTASRRLSLAARTGGKRLFLARAGSAPQPSAAESRWSVRSNASTSLEGDAPGRPAFSVTLLRHRRGAALKTWMMEWDRETRSFVERTALSGGLVSMAAERPGEATGHLRRHT
jgi:protein ImuA